MNKNSFFKGESDLFLFREGSLMAVAAIVSLLLQIISFFTTWNGAKAYFDATFAYAPLLFAIAVQTVVYFLANGIRRRVTALKIIALALAMSCSTYFSFVGIYNSVNPPSQYLEQTYTAYSKTLSSYAGEYVKKGSDEYSTTVNNGVNEIISHYSVITAEKQSLSELAVLIENSSAVDSGNMVPPYRYDYETYEEYAAAYKAYIEGLSQSTGTEQAAKLEALLQKYGVADHTSVVARIAEISAQLSLADGTVAAFGGNSFQMRAENMRARALSGDENACMKLTALYKSFCNTALEMPPYILANSADLKLPEYTELAGDDPPAVVRERASAAVSAACSQLSDMGIKLSVSDYGFENIYLLPINAVMRGEGGTDALISLILAALVDMLSLLFAMIFVRSRSVLAAKSTSSAVRGDEMLFERNIITAVQIGMCADGSGFSDKVNFDDIADRLGAFVSCFRAVDFAAEKGYTLVAERQQLVHFEALIAFLCQFGLAKLLTAEEMSLICGKEYEESVLLKTKFILWLSEKQDTCSRETTVQAEKAVTA